MVNNISPQIEHRNIFEAHLKNGINLFLGAGFSIHSYSNVSGKKLALPIGSTLLDEIKTNFNKSTSNLDLSQLCQILSRTKKNELYEYFRNRFNVIEFDNEYNSLFNINIKSIITTNIDNLIFKIYENNQNFYINDLHQRGAIVPDHTSINYLALHGSVMHDLEEDFDFTPTEIAASFDKNNVLWNSYRLNMQQHPTLYWGYRLKDAGVLQALYQNNLDSKQEDSWIILREHDEDEIEYFRSLGLKIIIADTLEMLQYLESFQQDINITQTDNTLETLYPEFAIPTKTTKIPVRKIDDFYLGAEPTWFDIIHGKIHKTEYFHQLYNSILGNKHNIILGTQVTGKTTLLKQLALAINNSNHICLYINDITPEKAHALFHSISQIHQKIYIFIDNIADSWQATNILIKSKNIIIIGAERDYIFDSVAHRFSYDLFIRHEISSLNPTDIVSIQEFMPHLRKNTKKLKHHFDDDLAPTFFDMMQENGIYDEYIKRFTDALNELKIVSPVKYDLLLLCCYAYHCRIPLSIGMVLSYLTNVRITNELGGNYAKLYESIKGLSAFITEYEDYKEDQTQDYYITKSKYLSHFILVKKLHEKELKTLLETFHTNISTVNIVRYDIFKRSAYDANLIERAYPNWQDGVDFYTKYRYRDHTHHFDQQAAVYLLRKKQYIEAFKWIEEARKKARAHAISSINNTYAIILFRANIETDKPYLATTIESLHESMEILINCYDSDLKKPYHVKKFSEQAIEFSHNLPNDSKSLEYLNQALGWVQNELTSNPKNRGLLNNQRELTNAIRTLKYNTSQ